MTESIIKLKKEIRFLRMAFIALFIIHLMTFASLVFSTYNLIRNSYQIHNPTMYFEEMDTNEIKNALTLIGEVKPNYMQIQKEIKFTKNISKYCDNCIGLNKGKSIIVEYSPDNLDATKYTLCHELLHNAIRSGDMGEYFTEETSKYLPCYDALRDKTQPQGGN